MTRVGGDFAQFLQLFLHGTGSASDGVVCKLRTEMVSSGCREFVRLCVILARLATASKSGLASVTSRIARRSLVLASPKKDHQQMSAVGSSGVRVESSVEPSVERTGRRTSKNLSW